MSPSSRKFVPIILIFSGLILIFLATAPIVISQLNFMLSPASRLIDPTATSPTKPFLVVRPLGLSIPDYTSAASWFSSSVAPASVATKSASFTLSIASINLNSVTVTANSVNLKTGPVHFPGTALPGSVGNSVVFGHSSLPYLFKPGSALTIFNPLPKIKVGDEVQVRYDSVTYKYVVKSTREVKPNDIDVLAQNSRKRELTLVTCVPLGTYWRRFVAVAELVN